MPARLFRQHLLQLHAEDGELLQREWKTLQLPQPTAADPELDNPADGTGKLNGLHNGKCDVMQHTCERSGAVDAVPVPVRGGQLRGRPASSVYSVDGYRRRGRFLVTSQPVGTASDALWQIVWEQRVAVVVLLGSLPSYSDRFWPDLGGVRRTAEFHIEGQTEHSLAFCVVRMLNLCKHKDVPRAKHRWRSVVLYQYTYWPEYGLPDNALPLLDFVVRASISTDCAGPTLVIAGQPSASLFLYVCLSTLLNQLNETHQLAVHSCCRHLAGQCALLSPSPAEYALLHTCLLERVSAGQTAVSRRDLWEFSAELRAATDCTAPALQRQYMSAVAMEPQQYAVISAGQPCNEHKNRSLAFIPVESSRVSLTPKPSVEGSDYINASWMPGFRHAREFLVTQHPLASTAPDFWQMIWENRVCTAVCLSPLEYGVFWPGLGEEMDCDNFVVRAVANTTNLGSPLNIVTLLLESTEGEEDLEVCLVLLAPWPHHLAAADAVSAVQRVSELNTGRRASITIIDKYGGTEAATFCVQSALLHQLQHEDRLDVYMYAKLYHQRRPGIWRTMEEYLALYRLVDAWVSESEPGDWTAPELDHPRASLILNSQTQPSALLPDPQTRHRALMETRLTGVDGVIV